VCVPVLTLRGFYLRAHIHKISVVFLYDFSVTGRYIIKKIHKTINYIYDRLKFIVKKKTYSRFDSCREIDVFPSTSAVNNMPYQSRFIVIFFSTK
jgi:hypothetical protein